MAAVKEASRPLRGSARRGREGRGAGWQAGWRAGQQQPVELRIAQAAMAIGKVEGRVENPGLGRDIPGRPGFARDLIAAADIADEDVEWRRWGIDGAGHDRTIAQGIAIPARDWSVMDAMRGAPAAHKKGEALPAPPLPSNRSKALCKLPLC